jgi:hypothetical protein
MKGLKMEISKDQEQQMKIEAPKLDLDTPTSFLGLTQRQINDWESRHRQFCKLAHRQPCSCSAWD